jgi:thiamine-phosphate pyrophosphorylase
LDERLTGDARLLRLCLVTDRAQTNGRDLVEIVRQCLDAGLPMVQVREKDLTAHDLAALCRPLRELTRKAGALLVVNDRVDVALAVGADAVQRTSTSLGIEEIRAIAGARLRIGASVHSREDAVEAERAGADFLVFGPVYDTPSKRRYGPPQGLVKLADAAQSVRIPVLAIGGIVPERAAEVRKAGASGVGAISALLSAESPADVTRRFLVAFK